MAVSAFKQTAQTIVQVGQQGVITSLLRSEANALRIESCNEVLTELISLFNVRPPVSGLNRYSLRRAPPAGRDSRRAPVAGRLGGRPRAGPPRAFEHGSAHRERQRRDQPRARATGRNDCRSPPGHPREPPRSFCFFLFETARPRTRSDAFFCARLASYVRRYHARMSRLGFRFRMLVSPAGRSGSHYR